MADDAVVLNANDAPFVEDERDAGEVDLFPGNMVQLNGSGQVVKHSTEAATGTGLMVALPFNPDLEKDEDATGTTGVGERIRLVHVPIGGHVDARLAPSGALTTNANANVTEGDLLVETDNGAVANFASGETEGNPEGALYVAHEGQDNTGVGAGVGNQIYIEVERIA